MAGIAFPSWAYNATLATSQIVQTQAAFTALGTGWSFSPFAPPPPTGVPFDVGFPDTDTRLQQLLIEARMANLMFAQVNNVVDDPQTVLRPDILATDSGLAT